MEAARAQPHPQPHPQPQPPRAGGIQIDLHHNRSLIDSHLLPLRQRLGAQALSEFSFANLFWFGAVHGYEFQGGALPCLAGHTYDGASHLMPLFDITRVSAAALRDRLHGHDAYHPLPADTAHTLAAAGWRVHAVRDDADYVYPADHFRHYRGRLLRKKHNQMRQLLDAGLPQAVAMHFPLAPAVLGAALQVLDQWCADKGQDGDRLACLAALRQGASSPNLGLEGTLVLRHGQPLGFVLFESYSPEVAVLRFAKGVDSAVGIYPYLFHQLCHARPALRWLNFEQDLGRPNFRQAKRSYQPAAMLEKFRVAPPA